MTVAMCRRWLDCLLSTETGCGAKRKLFRVFVFTENVVLIVVATFILIDVPNARFLTRLRIDRTDTDCLFGSAFTIQEVSCPDREAEERTLWEEVRREGVRVVVDHF